MASVVSINKFIQAALSPGLRLFCLVWLMCCNTPASFSQEISNPIASRCVGGDNDFDFIGPYTVTSWELGNGGQIVNNYGQSITAHWNNPGSTYVRAHYWDPNYGFMVYTTYTLDISSAVTPSVSISANSNPVCAGGTVGFTANAVNGGTGSSYSWYVNGNYVYGSSANTYSTSSLSNGQQVHCLFNPGYSGCYTTNSAYSNTITMTVNQPQALQVNLSGSSYICQGTYSGITAYVSNAAGNLSYQWKRNGQSISSNTSGPPAYVLVNNTLVQGDVITCTVTTDASCYTSGTSGSMNITIGQPVGTVPVPSGPALICKGTASTAYSAAAANASHYTWSISPASAGTISNNGTVTWNTSYTGDVTIGVTAYGCNNGANANSRVVSVKQNVGTPSIPAGTATRCQGSGTDVYTTTATDAVGYNWSISPLAAGTINGGMVTWNASFTGTATISVTANGCNGTSPAASRNIIISPTVGTPAVPSGINARPQGSGTNTYTTSAANASSYNWSISPAAAGSISASGVVTWNAAFGSFATISVTANGCNGPSAAASLDVCVYLPLTVPGITGPTSVASNAVPGTISSVGGPNGGNCNYAHQLQWEKKVGAGAWEDIPGATNSFYDPLPLQQTTSFRLRWVRGTETVWSNTHTITVYPQVIPGVVMPPIQYVMNGATAETLTAGPASGGNCNGQYGYQWEVLHDGNPWLALPGATGLSFQPGVITSTRSYRVKVTCGSDILYSNAVVVQVVYDDLITPGFSYLRVREITRPGITTPAAAQSLSNVIDVKESTQYFDLFGRLSQTVLKKASGETTPRDIVVPLEYDIYGREINKYMPYVAAGSDGNYKNNAIAAQHNFNKQRYPGEYYYYSQVDYEASPLNRVLKSKAPGMNWAGSSRGVSSQLFFNTATDAVKLWEVTNGMIGGSSFRVLGNYTAGTLFKSIKTDEQGKQVVEFTDKHGLLILKKVQLTATADNGDGSSYPGWICTYYCYDAEGRVRLVIQPRGIELLHEAGWTTAKVNEILPDQCFRYEYDYRGRLVARKNPSVDWEYMVYDIRDRLVFTQNAQLRTTNQWHANLYDAFNRQVIKGLLTFLGTVEGLQGAVNYQSPANGETSTVEGVAVNKNPLPPGSVFTTHLVTYYDNYAWHTQFGSEYGSKDNSFDSQFPAASGNWPYPAGLTQSNQTIGMVTGVWDKTQNLVSALFYDAEGRVIQTKGKNITGGIDILTTQYSFYGQVLQSVMRHEKKGNNIQTHTIITKNTYDDLGRMKTIAKSVSSTVGGQNIVKPEQVIASYEYDELGKLKKKTLAPGGGPGGGNLETLEYDYNIRGWLLGVNRNYLHDQGNPAFKDNYFGFELGYDKTAATPGSTSFSKAQYNGNVAGAIWKSRGDQVRRKYDFDYDQVNRFGKATFTQNTAATGGAWNNNEANFSVYGIEASNNNMIRYDANGNIQDMVQHGMKAGNPNVVIDALRYKYKFNSNQLEHVRDDHNVADSKLGDFHYTGTKNEYSVDYGYDPGGNLISDNNKQITSITYNHLNLPQLITVAGKGSIEYVYDGYGNKLKKIIHETGQPDKTTLYLGVAIYEQDILQFIGHEEGRLRFTSKVLPNNTTDLQLHYDYFLKDQLGNIRMVLTQEAASSQYLASMELASRAIEEQVFYNIPQTAIAKTAVVGGYPTDDLPVTNPNDLVAVVEGNANKVGPALVLKVMAGDRVDLGVRSFYANGSAAGGHSDPVLDILGSLSSGVLGIAGESKGTAASLGSVAGPLGAALILFQNSKSPPPSDKPKAYLNWILLDENLKLVTDGSGAIPVQSAGGIHTLSPGIVNMTRNGFLFVYVSNETRNWKVYFDNLSVQHLSGPMIEESHYYPFGLLMAGISHKALGKLQNKYKFNGGNELQSEEFTDGSGLDLYDAGFRLYDPQIGRFHQADVLADVADAWSPYAFAYDNPLSYNDPFGLSADTAVPGVPEMPPVIVVPPSGKSPFTPVCMTCLLPVIDTDKTLRPVFVPLVILSLADPGEYDEGDTKDNPTGLINAAPDRMYDNYPVKAFMIDLGFEVLSYTGWNTIDDYIARRFDSENNSAGDLAYETAGLIIFGPGNMKRTPGKTVRVKGFKVHHLGTNKHHSYFTPQLKKIADKYKLSLDGEWNKALIPEAYHYSNHPIDYHELSLRAMQAADAAAKGNRAVFIMTYHQKLIEPLMRNPNLLNRSGK